MKPGQLLSSAVRGIAGNMVRSTLTLIMVVIGVGSVITMVAVGNGSVRAVNEQISSLGATSITVTVDGGPSGIRAESLAPEDALFLRNNTRAPAVNLTAPVVQVQKTATAGQAKTEVTVIGTTPEYFSITNSTVQSGRPLSGSDNAANRPVVVIGSRIADALFPGGTPLGQTILVDGSPLTVVGVLSPKDESLSTTNDSIIVPLDRARATFSGFGSLSSISLTATAPDTVPAAIAQAREILATRTGVPVTESRLYFSSQQELRSLLGGSSESLSNMLTATAAISLLVGGLGVMNVMLLTVRERTKEIGIRKALGARSTTIATQFTLEATMLSVAGGVLGLIAALGVTAFPVLGIQPVILPSSVVLAVGISVLMGIVFGTYPAIRAARMNPVQALRSGT